MSDDWRTMREAFGFPERQWISYGIVSAETDDQKSVIFDNEDGSPLDEGPFVIVTLQPSGLEVPCRVSAPVAGNGEGEWHPFIQGDEVLVAIPEGDERAGAIIIGRCNNAIDKWPRQVGGNDTTKNAVAFARKRVPFILETASSYIVRSAKTGAYFGITDDGKVTFANGGGGYLALNDDFVGLSTDASGTDLLQLDSKLHQLNVGLNNGSDSLVVGGDTPGIRSQATFYIAAGGDSAVFHAATVEGTANTLLVTNLAMLAALGTALAAAFTATGATPVTGASAGTIITGVFTAFATAYPPLLATAYPAAAGTPMLPALQAAVATALAIPLGHPPITDPLSATAALQAAGLLPGVGSPYLSIV